MNRRLQYVNENPQLQRLIALVESELQGRLSVVPCTAAGDLRALSPSLRFQALRWLAEHAKVATALVVSLTHEERSSVSGSQAESMKCLRVEVPECHQGSACVKHKRHEHC